MLGLLDLAREGLTVVAAQCADMSGADLHVLNPASDYIPPELISLFVTETGCHMPSYVYRLVGEYYAPQDYSLSLPG